MDSTPLLKLMSADIAQQREESLSVARHAAEEIEVEARKTGERRYGNAMAMVDSELQAVADRARGRSEAESHMVLMTTKDTVTDELLAAVGKELASIASGSGFSAILDSLLAEVMQEGPSDGIVLAPKAHVEQCRSWLTKNGHPHKVEGVSGMTDGVAVQDISGTYRVTNTLSARFEKQKGALRKHCIERLFDKEAQA